LPVAKCSSSGPGIGIVDQTIQYHSAADLYNLNGASSLATLYSDANTVTTYPAVTQNTVGSNGGKAIAFTYDLARSIVYTRQGNPEWAGQERDGSAPIRSNDLYWGNASGDVQPDWIDLSKVEIPQADEQQHLLSNIITLGNLHLKPLPRFWFLPKGLKAAIVMTGDNHGDGGMIPRFEKDISLSPAGCSVEDWECVRSTGYLYVGSSFTDAMALQYHNLGFEVALHVNTNCVSYTQTQFEDFITTQMSNFGSTFPSIPLPKTNRNHCIAWNDWGMPAQVEANFGIRLDVNYYYWPNSWVNNQAGMFTGSGFPMRFATLDGSIIDCYQIPTQMQDESGSPATQYPSFCDALLDKAIGPEGYYGVFATNMHFDHHDHPGANAIVASAQSRGIPVVSAQQMLDWLDGRNESAFESIEWNSNTLSFTVSIGAGALNVKGMLPVQSENGSLIGLTLDGGPLSYTTEIIKGINYGFFDAIQGDYIATYGTDDIGPTISNIVATSQEDGTVIITWETDELSNSQVDYGTTVSLGTSVSNASLVTSHSVTLNSLLPSTTYYYRVISTDGFTNSTTSPILADPPLEFITSAVPCAKDETDEDFNLGSADANILVILEEDGAVILMPTLNEEFSENTLPTEWSEGIWNAGGTTFSDGQVTVNGTHIYSNSSFSPGSSIEFVATFNLGAYQNIGLSFSQAFDDPWVTIGQGTSADGNLYARAHSGAAFPDILLGSDLLGTPHKFRIEWNNDNFKFYIDNEPTPTATINITIGTDLYVQISDYQNNDGTLSVDWLRVSPYATPGSFVSRVFDQGSPDSWGEINWNSIEPIGSDISLFARLGNTATPDGTWTEFAQVTNGQIIGGNHQYIQYRADLNTSNISLTPILQDVDIVCESDPDITPPIITNIEANPGLDGVSAIITWDTDEWANSSIMYGTDPGVLTLTASDGNYMMSHSLILNGLSTETTYYYRVTSEDLSTNSTTEPILTDPPLSFTTLLPAQDCFTDQYFNDFGLGTTTYTYVSNFDDGEVILNPTLGEEFTNASIPSGWQEGVWGVGGSLNYNLGSVTINNGRLGTTNGFGPGTSIEFNVIFTADDNENIGSVKQS